MLGSAWYKTPRRSRKTRKPSGRHYSAPPRTVHPRPALHACADVLTCVRSRTREHTSSHVYAYVHTGAHQPASVHLVPPWHTHCHTYSHTYRHMPSHRYAYTPTRVYTPTLTQDTRVHAHLRTQGKVASPCTVFSHTCIHKHPLCTHTQTLSLHACLPTCIANTPSHIHAPLHRNTHVGTHFHTTTCPHMQQRFTPICASPDTHTHTLI